MSKAAISKIERMEASPTAQVLIRLAGAFDLTFARLLLKAEGEGQRLVRKSEQKSWLDPETGYRRTQVFALASHPVELVEVELPQDTRITLPASSYVTIRQVVWVRAGTLRIEEDGQTSVLEEGDCLGFGPPSEVTFVNTGRGTCRYVVALARSS